MTSNLSLQQPYVMPFPERVAPPERTYFLFKEREFARLFPPAVVAHMTLHQPPRPFPIAPKTDLHYLPDADHLPVIVAVRMSLAHPGLFSAVPLSAVTQQFVHDRAGNVAFPLRDDPAHVRETWFSDGGIVSNFPIHIFDRWFPDCPTFGINLADSLKVNTGPNGQPVVDLSYLVCPQGVVAGRRADPPRPDAVHLPLADEVPVAEWRPIDGVADVVSAIFYTVGDAPEQGPARSRA